MPDYEKKLKEETKLRTQFLEIDCRRWSGDYKIAKIVPFIKPPTEGIYITGNVDPIFPKDKDFIFQETKKSVHDCAPGKLKNISSAVLDDKGRIYVNKKKYIAMRNYLIDKPNFNTNLVKLVAAMTVERLSQFIENKIRMPFDVQDLLVDGCDRKINLVAMHEIFSNLHRHVDRFIGIDYYCQYHCDLKNHVVKIEKGLDARILEWYQRRIETQ